MTGVPSASWAGAESSTAGDDSGIMAHLRGLIRGSHIDRRPIYLAILVALAAVLQLSGGVGVAYVAGFSKVQAVLGNFLSGWPYMCGALGFLLLSFVGYYYAYEGIYHVEGGPRLNSSQMRAVVIAGFGGFFAHGGGALDKYALESAGTDERDAKARVASLAGLEHGVLGLIGQVAAIVVLASGFTKPPLDFTLPWAIIPLPGFLVAFWFGKRFKDMKESRGWRSRVKIFVVSIYLVRQLFVKSRRYWYATIGMAAFWLADMFAAWCAMAAFGFLMNGAQFLVGMGTGMVFTRRTGPLAGAGVLALVLPVTVWYSGAPFAVAVAGIFAYRVLALWLPMPASLASLSVLRDMGRGAPQMPGEPGTQGEPALRQKG